MSPRESDAGTHPAEQDIEAVAVTRSYAGETAKRSVTTLPVADRS